MKKAFRITASILLMGTVLLSGCSKTPKIDKDVNADNINMSASNAAHGFLQAVFTKDKDLFVKVYLNEDTFETLCGGDSIRESGEYYGISYSAEEPATEEYNWDGDMLGTEISEEFDISKDDIKDIKIVKERIYFKDSGKYQYTDAYVVVYKYDSSWYAFTIQDPDADIRA